MTNKIVSKSKYIFVALTIIISFFYGKNLQAQSTNCSTATNINLSSGSACVNGTSVGAVTDNTLYGSCNTAPVNMVWYTYVANGSNNTFTVTPGTLTNAEIVIYTGSCPAGGQLETCHTANGNGVLTTTWGMTLGQQVWVGVASNGGISGTFQLCINSTPPAPGVGNTCAQSIPICNSSFSQASMSNNSSGQKPTCFGSAPQQDVWFKFTITQAGNLAWTGTPNTSSDEFDWCLWDISSGCPGTVACCNYNYAGGSSQGFGMQAQTGTVACGYSTSSYAPKKEFCAPIAVACGKTYAIQISNFASTGTGFSFSFASSTCLINSTSSFTPTPSLICGTTLNATIANSSTGGCAAVWSFGDGSANYTGTTPPNHTYNSPGTYAITENIGGACPSSATQFVQLLAPLAATVTPTSPNCASALCNGTATVTTVSGGDGVYTYSWSAGGSTTNSASGLCDGANTVTVSNAKCGTSVTQTVNIITPPALTITPTPVNLTSCTTNNGSISVVGSGGTSPYTYALNTGAFSATSTFNNLAVGTYTVYVKDNKSCQTFTTVTLTAPLSPTVTVNSATICPGGTATLTATGATTYSWNPSSSSNPLIVSPNVTTIYTVTGTASGCTASATATVSIGSAVSITVPSATICAGTSTTLTASGATNYTWSPGTGLNTVTGNTVIASPAVTTTYTINGATGACTGTTTAVVTINSITATVTTSPTTCSGATGSATATCGGTAPFNYTWTPSAATINPITDLPQGSYTVHVVDANGCSAIASGSVSVQGFTWSASATATNPKCFGSSDGTATVSITSPGTNTFTYSWNTAPVQTTSVATSLSANSYIATVTDNNGCSGTASVTLVNPAPITATVNTTPTICTGSVGSATATCGGLAPFTYTWTTNANTPTINNLPQGPYGVAITDANSCTVIATGSVSSIQTFSWSPVATATNPKCLGYSDGTATVTINNPGTNTFLYSWNTSPVQTTSVTTPTLSAGSYVVTVTDNNNCVSSVSVTLTAPLPITATVNTTPTICTGSVGSATVTILSGGIAPFQYTWLTNPAQPLPNTNVATNLPQGACSVFVTDANGCNTTPTAPSGTVLSTGYTWIPVAAATPTKCFGSSDGTATVSITNAGASTFTSYVWMPTAQTNSVATNLPIGNYMVTVTDNNGCIGTASTTVTQPSQLSASAQATPALCTSANGTASSAASGGTPPYSFSWNTGQTSEIISGLTQGGYTVSVTDYNGCPANATTIVKDTTDLKVTITPSPDLCNTGVGTAVANPTGQSPYTYTWTTTPVQNTQTADSLVVGTYSVNVIDVNGCTASASTTIINHNDVLASQLITTPEGEIYAENPIGLNIAANSGWSVTTAYLTDSASTIKTPITSNPFNYTFPKYGDYTAVYYYTSVNGCKDSAKYEIIVKDYMTLYIPNAFSPNGDGLNENFAAEGTFVNKFEMYIYDRWGILVIKLNSLNQIWDGTKDGANAQEDTYVYKGSASDIFGKSINFHGQVNLIR